jgi:hypothetical protein
MMSGAWLSVDSALLGVALAASLAVVRTSHRSDSLGRVLTLTAFFTIVFLLVLIA